MSAEDIEPAESFQRRGSEEPVFVPKRRGYQHALETVESVTVVRCDTATPTLIPGREKPAQQDLSMSDFQAQLRALGMEDRPRSASNDVSTEPDSAAAAFGEEEEPTGKDKKKKYLSMSKDLRDRFKIGSKNKYATENFKEKKDSAAQPAPVKKIGVYFNNLIELQPLYQDSSVPVILVCILEHLYETKAYLVEGIFRIGGNMRIIQELKDQADLAGEDLLATGLIQKHNDTHDICSMLKQWLKELPEPLIPIHTFTELLNAQKTEVVELRMAQFATHVAMMPPVNRVCLKHILYFAKLIVEYSDVNKMKLTNIANVLAPTIMRTVNDRDFLMNFGVAGGCLVFMLNQFSEVFGHYHPFDFMRPHLTKPDPKPE